MVVVMPLGCMAAKNQWSAGWMKTTAWILLLIAEPLEESRQQHDPYPSTDQPDAAACLSPSPAENLR